MTMPVTPSSAAAGPMRRHGAFLCPWLLPALLAAAPAAAAGPSFTAGAVTVEQPWSRATPGGAAVAVGYLTIRNAGDLPDRLVSASSALAGRVAPHSMTMADGVMTMRPLSAGLALPPHATVRLAPNGDHLMFEEIRQPLKAGTHFPATLVFERAGPLPVSFAVEGIGAKGPTDATPGAGSAMPGMTMTKP